MADLLLLTPFDSETFTIASGQTTSAPVPVKNPSGLGLIFPPMDGATANVEVSADGVNFFNIQNTSGSVQLLYAVGAGSFAVPSSDLNAVLGYAWMRVVAATQSAQRTLVLVRRIARTDPLA